MVYSVTFSDSGKFEVAKWYCKNELSEPFAGFYVGKYLAFVSAKDEEEAAKNAASLLNMKFGNDNLEFKV